MKVIGDMNIDLPCLVQSQTSRELPVWRTLTVPTFFFHIDIFDSLHGYVTEVRKFNDDINIDLPCLVQSQTSRELLVGRILTVPEVSIL